MSLSNIVSGDLKLNGTRAKTDFIKAAAIRSLAALNSASMYQWKLEK